MSILLPNGKVARNLQEQVCYLSEKVKEILEYIGQDASSALILEFEDLIPAEGTLTEEQLAKAQNDICFLVAKYHEGEVNTLFYKTGEDNEDSLIFFESIPSISVDDNEVVIGGIEHIEVRPLEGKFYYTYESVYPRVPTTSKIAEEYVTLATDQNITGKKTIKDFLYFDNSNSWIRFNSGNLDVFNSSGNVRVNTNLRPDIDNRRDLGNLANRFKNLTLSGSINFPESTSGNYIWGLQNDGGDGLNVIRNSLAVYAYGSSNFRPMTTNKDLGNSVNKWKDLYLSGKITDGTNEKPVKDILTTGFRFALPDSSVAETIDIVASGATSNQLNEGQTTFNNEIDRFALKLDNINQWIKRGYVVYKSSTGDPIRIYLTGMSYKNAVGSNYNMFAEDSYDTSEYAQGVYYLQFGASVNANQQTGAYARIEVVLSGQGSGNIRVEAFEDQQV